MWHPFQNSSMVLLWLYIYRLKIETHRQLLKILWDLVHTHSSRLIYCSFSCTKVPVMPRTHYTLLPSVPSFTLPFCLSPLFSSCPTPTTNDKLLFSKIQYKHNLLCEVLFTSQTELVTQFHLVQLAHPQSHYMSCNIRQKGTIWIKEHRSCPEGIHRTGARVSTLRRNYKTVWYTLWIKVCTKSNGDT